MNELGNEPLEAELQQLKPAAPPEDFMARLAHAPVGTRAALMPWVSAPAGTGGVWRLLRWLAPATVAGALLGVVLIRQLNTTADKSSSARPGAVESMVKADNVEIDRQLVATFDTVAQLPDGEPVRFRCSEWLDDVVLRDSTRGILIEHRMPLLEIVPVGFEVY